MSWSKPLLAERVGLQDPRILIVPQADDWGACDDALFLIEGLRTAEGEPLIELMPWQELIPSHAFARRGEMWAASDVGICVSRQNGKGGVLEALVLCHLLLFGARRVLWTAQLQRTASDAHKRMVALFRSCPDLAEMLDKTSRDGGITYGAGNETIRLKTGQEIKFFTRSKDAGRGLPADVLILDEAYDLTESELAALRPTLKTAANPQVIYTSTPPDEDVHPNGVVLARIRKRAMAQSGDARRLWMEWSVPTLEELTAAAEQQGQKLLGDPRLRDPAVWARGNPSLGYLFGEETIRADLENMGARQFLVEDLCAPDHWPDPDAVDAASIAIAPQTWRDRRDPQSKALDPVVVGIDVSPQRVSSISVAGWRADGRIHGELVQSAPGTGWVVPMLLEIVTAVDPAALVIDGKGPASTLLADIRAEGLDPQVLSSAERSQADDGLVKDIEQDRLELPGVEMPPLDAAAEAATWREFGDLRFFERRAGGAGISPLVSLSLARFGLLVHAAQPQRPPSRPPEPVKAAPAGDDRELDLMTAGF